MFQTALQLAVWGVGIFFFRWALLTEKQETDQLVSKCPEHKKLSKEDLLDASRAAHDLRTVTWRAAWIVAVVSMGVLLVQGAWGDASTSLILNESFTLALILWATASASLAFRTNSVEAPFARAVERLLVKSSK